MITQNTPIEILPFTINELTELNVEEGKGVLDILLRNLRLNLDIEYEANRINGIEYAQVYSELYQANLNASINYVATRTKLGYELNILKLQADQLAASLLKVPAEIAQIEAETEQIKLVTSSRIPAEIANIIKQGEIADKQLALTELELTLKAPAEIAQITAQTALITAQKSSVLEELTLVPHKALLLQGQVTQVGAETTLTLKNVDRIQEELAKIPLEAEILRKESLKSDAQISLVNKQVEEATLQLGKIPKEIEFIVAQTAKQTADIAQTTATTDRISKETLGKLPIEISNLAKVGLQAEAETQLTISRKAELLETIKKVPVEIEYMQSQITNMAKQTLILDKNLELKLGELDIQLQQIDINKAELDIKREQLLVTKAQVLSNQAQADLYKQKVVTEVAQTDATVIGTGSVIALNNLVLEGQISGYKRDAEQKSAKVMLDAWMIGAQNQEREANAINKLTDTSFGMVMTKLFQGIDLAI